eukprot:scaffold17531_cov241-Isochrysis_galbana.AAC.10
MKCAELRHVLAAARTPLGGRMQPLVHVLGRDERLSLHHHEVPVSRVHSGLHCLARLPPQRLGPIPPAVEAAGGDDRREDCHRHLRHLRTELVHNADDLVSRGPASFLGGPAAAAAPHVAEAVVDADEDGDEVRVARRNLPPVLPRGAGCGCQALNAHVKRGPTGKPSEGFGVRGPSRAEAVRDRVAVGHVAERRWRPDLRH